MDVQIKSTSYDVHIWYANILYVHVHYERCTHVRMTDILNYFLINSDLKINFSDEYNTLVFEKVMMI